MAQKSLSIRIESEMLDKLHVVADYEGRSANSQILILIRDCIEAYEDRFNAVVLVFGMSLKESLWAAETAFLTACEKAYNLSVFEADIVIWEVLHNSGGNITAWKVIVSALNVLFTVCEVDPYDSTTVFKNGSFRGLTATLREGMAY